MGTIIIAVGGLVTATGVLVKALENLQDFKNLKPLKMYFSGGINMGTFIIAVGGLIAAIGSVVKLFDD